MNGMAIDPAALDAALASVRPLVLGHGGTIAIADVEDGIVTVELGGACEACPNKAMTYAGPVRSALLDVPGVIDVRCRRIHASPRALNRIAMALGARPFDQ